MSPDSPDNLQALLLRDLLEAAGQVRTFTAGMDRSAFLADLKTQMAVRMSLTIIGEVAGKVSEDVKAATPGVPWRKIKDLRNMLVHVYWQIDAEILWDLVQNHVPVLEVQIRAIVDRSTPESK